MERAGILWVVMGLAMALSMSCSKKDALPSQNAGDVLAAPTAPSAVAAGEPSYTGDKIVADPGCEDGCKYWGKCVNKDGVCVAGNVEHCRQSQACTEGGQCSIKGYSFDSSHSIFFCTALTDADCKNALDCKQNGECKASDGKCVTIPRPSHMPCHIKIKQGTITKDYGFVFTDKGLPWGSNIDEEMDAGDGAVDLGLKGSVIYTFGDDGRLTEVVQVFPDDRKTSLKLNYGADGRLSRYEFKEPLEKGINGHVGEVIWGSNGNVTQLKERGKIGGGTVDFSATYKVSYGAGSNLYQGSVIVWPFTADRPYLGWVEESGEVKLLGKKGGGLTKFEFGSDGRIDVVKHFSIRDGVPDDLVGVWKFIYECDY